MRTKEWVALTAALALATPAWAAETNAAQKSETKSKTAKAEPPEPVYNPEPAVAKQNNVNVRGQPSITSEVITRLHKEQPVTVLEEITLRKPKQDEPAKWYRIALPTNAPVWVHTDFIAVTNKSVIPSRLNLRGGPGENYSVLGRLTKGTVVKEIEVRGDWIRIEPTTNATAFVAAHLLAKVPLPAKPEPTPTPPPETPIATAPAPKPAVDQPAPTPAQPPIQPTVVTPPPTAPVPVVSTAQPALPEAIQPATKRIVTREGWVRRVLSPQAPTYFELESRDTKRTINYIYVPSAHIDVKKLKGRLIQVTGEESLDERWPNTPVITAESFEILF